MTTIKTYDPSMQSAIEACFKACVEALGWAYQPDGRHSDIVNIETAYMRHGRFWCLFVGDELIGVVAIHCLDNDNRIAELKRLYVLPERQGKGYGGLLFGLAMDYTKEQGYRIIRADTRHDRAASLHLIDKYRLRRIERYNENAFAELYFELDLTK
jgi:putative acetyltransferase